MRSRYLFIVALALTVAGALVEGSYSGRWGTPPDLSAAAESIGALPETIGEWQHVADGDRLTKSISNELGLLDHINRVYEHTETGQRVQLLLMVGRPGPLVRHPPTVCYANRAHKQLGEPRWVFATDDRDPTSDRFQLLTYKPARASGEERFYVAYSHSIGERWDTPDLPRLAYGGAPALYKAQTLLNVNSEREEPAALEQLTTFLREFIATFAEMRDTPVSDAS
ncbi:MAG: exosortase-associated EpsI family protein [Planctomycetota bacterium]